MTGAQLYELNTQIRGGRALDEPTFYTLLNLARSTWEGYRVWRQLIKISIGNLSGPADTYLTAKTLPTGFISASRKNPLILISSGGQKIFYKEIPLETLIVEKDVPGYFAVDLANNCYYLTGTVNDTYSHYFAHTKRGDTIGTGDTWGFPGDYHPYLAFEVAVMDELGMDYDETNARQAGGNAARSALVLKTAVKWDDQLWRSALNV